MRRLWEINVAIVNACPLRLSTASFRRTFSDCSGYEGSVVSEFFIYVEVPGHNYFTPHPLYQNCNQGIGLGSGSPWIFIEWMTSSVSLCRYLTVEKSMCVCCKNSFEMKSHTGLPCLNYSCWAHIPTPWPAPSLLYGIGGFYKQLLQADVRL